MIKSVLLLASVSALLATPAFAAPESFVRDGTTYEYTVSKSGEYQIISGRDVNSGKTFNLKVRGSKVVGDYAGKRVAFEAPKAADKVASR
jgi:hypothetical protein